MEFRIGQLVKYSYGDNSPYYIIGNKDGVVTILIGNYPTQHGYGLIATAEDVSTFGFDKKYIDKYFCVFRLTSLTQLTLFVKKICKICKDR